MSDVEALVAALNLPARSGEMVGADMDRLLDYSARLPAESERNQVRMRAAAGVVKTAMVERGAKTLGELSDDPRVAEFWSAVDESRELTRRMGALDLYWPADRP
jgi:hypothetical protein